MFLEVLDALLLELRHFTEHGRCALLAVAPEIAFGAPQLAVDVLDEYGLPLEPPQRILAVAFLVDSMRLAVVQGNLDVFLIVGDMQLAAVRHCRRGVFAGNVLKYLHPPHLARAAENILDVEGVIAEVLDKHVGLDKRRGFLARDVGHEARVTVVGLGQDRIIEKHEQHRDDYRRQEHGVTRLYRLSPDALIASISLSADICPKAIRQAVSTAMGTASAVIHARFTRKISRIV